MYHLGKYDQSILQVGKDATILADIYFTGASRRRGITCDNVRLSGIATSEVEVRRIAKHSFRHFACLVIDSLKS